MAFRTARIASLAVLAMAAGASADVVIFDQIGAGTTSTNTQGVYASQDFETANNAFDIAGIDDFSTPGGTISRVEAVMALFSGGQNYAGVTGWRVEVYTSTAAAGTSLTGNAGSQTVAPGAVTITGGYTPNGTNGSLISIPVNLNLAAGNYWIGVIPVMDFTPNGQTGISASTLSAGVPLNAGQANPGAGFGQGAFFSPAGGANFAYRISIVPAPGSLALLGLGGLAAARRRRR